jgi:hypothetical protein
MKQRGEKNLETNTKGEVKSQRGKKNLKTNTEEVKSQRGEKNLETSTEGGDESKRKEKKSKEEGTQKKDAPPIRSALKRCTSRSRGIQTHLERIRKQGDQTPKVEKRRGVNMNLNTEGR